MLDDICQEVLISIHKAIHTWQSDQPFFPGCPIVYRCIDEIRKWSRIKKIEIQSLEAMEAWIGARGYYFSKRIGAHLDRHCIFAAEATKLLSLDQVGGNEREEVAETTGMGQAQLKCRLIRLISPFGKKSGLVFMKHNHEDLIGS